MSNKGNFKTTQVLPLVNSVGEKQQAERRKSALKASREKLQEKSMQKERESKEHKFLVAYWDKQREKIKNLSSRLIQSLMI